MPPRPRLSNILNTRLKKPRKRIEQAARRLAELEEAEGSWCERECDNINSVLMGSAAPSTSASVIFEEDVDQMPSPFYYSDGDGSNSEDMDTGYDSDSADSNITQASSVAEGVSAQVLGDINRRRRIREEAQWKEVITPMFSVFMLCQDQSRQWTDHYTWNKDLKPDCQCSQAKKRFRDVEMVDILSKLSLISPRFFSTQIISSIYLSYVYDIFCSFL